MARTTTMMTRSVIIAMKILDHVDKLRFDKKKHRTEIRRMGSRANWLWWLFWGSI